MDGGSIKVSKNFRKLVERIIESEVERTGRCSQTQATEILFKRIMNAGGIRGIMETEEQIKSS